MEDLLVVAVKTENAQAVKWCLENGAYQTRDLLKEASEEIKHLMLKHGRATKLAVRFYYYHILVTYFPETELAKELFELQRVRIEMMTNSKHDGVSHVIVPLLKETIYKKIKKSSLYDKII